MILGVGTVNNHQFLEFFGALLSLVARSFFYVRPAVEAWYIQTEGASVSVSFYSTWTFSVQQCGVTSHAEVSQVMVVFRIRGE